MEGGLGPVYLRDLPEDGCGPRTVALAAPVPGGREPPRPPADPRGPDVLRVRRRGHGPAPRLRGGRRTTTARCSSARLRRPDRRSDALPERGRGRPLPPGPRVLPGGPGPGLAHSTLPRDGPDGGHTGFIHGRVPWRVRCWAEERAVEWVLSPLLCQGLPQRRDRRQAPGRPSTGTAPAAAPGRPAPTRTRSG